MEKSLAKPFDRDAYPEPSTKKTGAGRDDRLKIIIIHQGMTHLVLPLLKSRHKVVSIVESRSGKKPGRLMTLVKAMHAAVNPNFTTLKILAKIHRIPYYDLSHDSEKDLAAWVRNLSPDLIAIHTMARLLKPAIFSIPRLGAINLHQSYLPAYRGPNPDFWHYHDMEMHPGVTVHFIDSGEDTGDIIFQERVAIPLGTRSPERLDKLVGDVGASLFLKALDALADSSAPRIPQPRASPTSRARKITGDEHRKIIDWNTWDIERIWHLLRGTEQWLNAIDGLDGFYKGQRWRIEEFITCEMSGYHASAIYRERGRYFVACRQGRIFIRKTFSLKRFLLAHLRR